MAAANLTCADLLTTPGVGSVALTYTGSNTVVLGSAIPLVANATVNGGPLSGARFSVTSSDSAVVDIRADSLVGRKLGTAVVTVSLVSSLLPSAAPSVSQSVTVVPGSVTLDSASVTFASIGDTVRLGATILDANSQPVTGVAVQWRSTDTSRVDVNASGRVIAKRNGTAQVIATASGKADTATITVAQVLAHYTFLPAVVFLDALAASSAVTATGRDGRGNAMTGVAPVFSVRDPSIALVGAATGTVTSLLNGQTVVYATRGAVVDSVAVTVDQRATLVVIQPDPIPPVTSLGTQVQLTARAFDRNAVEIQGSVPAWFTLDPARVSVSPTGLVTVLAIGNADIIASLDGVNDTSRVTISNSPATVIVTPDTATASSVGDTLIFTALVLNGAGDSIPGSPVTWRTPDTTIVRVLANGRAVTLASGFARVIAQAGIRSDTGFALVTNQVAFINISPLTRTLTALADVDTPAVTITNARSAGLARTSVTWTSDDAAIARVNAQGIVTAVDTGVTLIRASTSTGFFRDSVQYTIQNVPTSIVLGGRVVDTLTALGQLLVYPATVRNRRNAVIPKYPVTWRSTNLTVVDTVPGDSAVAIGFGVTLLIAEAVPGVADTAALVVVNLTRLLVDNSVVVTAGTPRVGTGSRPYARIQDAVDAADALDTVFVRRGLGSYSESIALTKRLTLLGDSGSATAANSYLGSNRNPANLPLIAHDAGAAAITAFTTAPQTIRYLAVRHTLDGPALDADGSDVTVEYLYVNPSVTSRIGRGISIKNSPSGTGVRRSVIRSVRGYGIRLENVQGAVIFSDSIVGVDSVASVEEGVAVKMVGGGTIVVSTNTLREAQGPLIAAGGSAAITVVSNLLYGRQTQMLLDNLATTSASVVSSNTFDLNFVTGNDNLFSANDGRAGLLIRNTVGTTIAPVSVNINSFVAPISVGASGFTGGTMDAIRIVDSRLITASTNTFRGMRYAFRTTNATGTSITRAVADSISTLVSAEGLDSLTLNNDTVRVASGVCVTYPSTVTVGGVSVPHSDPSSISIFNSRFERCASFSGGFGIQVNSASGTPDLTVSRTTVLARANATAVQFSGGDLIADSSTFVASTVAGDTARFGLIGFPAVDVFRSTTAQFYRNVIADFRRVRGLRLGATNSLQFGGNRITRNGSGFTYIGDGAGSPTLAIVTCSSCNTGRKTNGVFDNDTLGFTLAGVSGTFPDSVWWGDGRGPRNGAAFAPTGDSVLLGGIVTFTNSDAPLDTGVTAVGLRVVRGNGRFAPASSALLPALTVRVVDANGFPVAGVGVTFMVTGGGGNFAGPTTLNRVTNIDGLAEVNLTLGSTPGTNTVTVTGTTQALGSVIFTATGQ